MSASVTPSPLALAIAAEQSRGAQLVSQDDSGAILVVSRPKRVRHVLHAILTFVTLFWGIVWVVLAVRAHNNPQTVQVQLAVTAGGAVTRSEIVTAS